MKHNYRKPRSSPTAGIIVAAFARHGAMTIDQCARVTGLHTERIRRVVKQPRFAVTGLVGTVPVSKVWELKEVQHGQQTPPAPQSL